MSYYQPGILATPVPPQARHLFFALESVEALPAAIERHNSQLPQGSGVGPSLAMQLSDRARMRALEVLPVPLGPLNK